MAIEATSKPMKHCAFLIPGDLNLPTGGYAYDRRVLSLLGEHGVAAEHVALPDSYPLPLPDHLAETSSIVQGLGAEVALLVDGLALGAIPAGMLRSWRQPIVALCHHPLCLEAGLDKQRETELRASETAALSLAKAVIVTSPATKAILMKDFDVSAGRITVALPGTDPAPRAVGSKSPMSILAVGSIVPRKGYDVLVRALARLGELDWRMTIVGAADRSPQTVAALQAAIVEHGLGHRICLTGPLGTTDLERHYAAADVFVMPSLFEGYGMVIAEAMMRGLPIVCTTGGAAADTAPDTAAIKVPPGDASALAEGLRTTLTNSKLRQDMALSAWVAGQHLPRWAETARIVADVVKGVGR